MSDDRLVIDHGDDVTLRGSLALVRADGTEVWRVMPPRGVGDRWTEARFDGDRVSAFSWSCYRVTLDAETGTELDRVFTK
jgi:hypothetical protein